MSSAIDPEIKTSFDNNDHELDSSNMSNNSPSQPQDPDPEKQSPVQTNIIEVPDGGYGWFIVIAVFCFNVATWASNSAFAIYLAHYLKENKFEGATKIDYAAIGGIAFGVGLFCAPAIIYFIGITGPRTCIIVGGCFQFSGIMLAAFSTKLWQLYLTQGLLISYGLAFVCIPANILLPQWFRKKRSLAQALSASGSGAGGVMFNLAMQHIIEIKSVKWALITQAIICAVVTGIGCALTRTRNEHVKPTFQFYDIEVITKFGFWIMSFWIATTLLGYVVILYNLADFTRSLGYSGSQGSIVSCMISVGVFFGRPTIGQLSDKFGAVSVAMWAHLLVAIFCFGMWIPLRNYASAIAFAIIVGSLMGTIWAVLGTIVSRIVGLRKLATTLGSLWVIIGIFGTVSPLIGIQLRSSPGAGQEYSPIQYQHPAIWCGVCYFAAAMSLWIMRGYLIARDEIAEEQNSHMDNGELHIKVPFKKIFGKMFVLSKLRKV
ncbi:putative transporter MCH2 [Wickerhamomyces ciferrii]|uniref:Transporter MCH2 n=1 Tax=Wickerhamomyces ciferrii (strain ATCC 14091 / BCRC 22168 / CBS 111 / JCM 3599 / NBRC 0793 / NRRL Y-1031 F-60-10) TaxID=1206466 RepID=K0KNC6_WICCF|nr:putative transporter MCH2 [Wickerhamomyces ciferrii]CCH43687.1 putative transporter MCH2 [Wickerhamomyces ciferrii]